MPEGAEAGIVKGMYLLKAVDAKAKGHRVQVLGCGAILREAIAGAELLQKDFGIAADIWSVTSFTELAREAQDVAALESAAPRGKAARCLRDRDARQPRRTSGDSDDRLHENVC